MATSTEDRVHFLTAQVHHLQASQRRTHLAIFAALAVATLLLPAARLDPDRDQPGSGEPLSLLRLWLLLVQSDPGRFGDLDEYPFRLPVGLLLAQIGISVALAALIAALLVGTTIPARPTSRATTRVVLIVAALLILGCLIGALGVWLLPDGRDNLDPAVALLTGIGAAVWLAVDARE